MFEFGIGGGLNVTIELTPLCCGTRQYDKIRYYDRYDMVVIRYTIRGERTVRISVPFYQSSGSNSSSMGNNTWFPFLCCSQGWNQEGLERYYRSEYGEAYIYKVGSYLLEPFSLVRFEGKYRSTHLDGQREYLRHMGVKIDDMTGEGAKSIYHRFGNLLYLMTSVVMFGVSVNWNADLYEPGTAERETALSLDRLINDRKIDGKSWISLMPKYEPEFDRVLRVNSGEEINVILHQNSVALPSHSDVVYRSENLSDRFLLSRIILQTIGEIGRAHV